MIVATGSGDLLSGDALAVFVSRPQVVCINTAAFGILHPLRVVRQSFFTMILTVFKLLSRLPLPLLHLLGAIFGVLALLRGRHASLLRDNLAQAGMQGQVSLIAVAVGLGQGVVELAAIWLRPLATVTGWVRQVDGLEHLAAAQAAGKGVVLLTPHLGCWELAGIWYGAQFPMTALYRPPKQPWAHALMKGGRERGHIVTVPPDRSGVKALLSAIKRGEAAFILPDQSTRDGVFAPFFGRPVAFPVLPYRLANSTGAAVLLLCCERLSWGRGYRLRISRIDPLPKDDAAAAGWVHARIEARIRALPAQYLWSYRIFRHHRGDTQQPPADISELAA
jgi:Kdo2-lipid IVA lauroyltransferase/acyltransferase